MFKSGAVEQWSSPVDGPKNFLLEICLEFPLEFSQSSGESQVFPLEFPPEFPRKLPLDFPHNFPLDFPSHRNFHGQFCQNLSWEFPQSNFIHLNYITTKVKNPTQKDSEQVERDVIGQ